jgi:hypothetical protein
VNFADQEAVQVLLNFTKLHGWNKLQSRLMDSGKTPLEVRNLASCPAESLESTICDAFGSISPYILRTSKETATQSGAN